MPSVTVYGAPYSTYTRSVLIALQEKHVNYRLEMVDIFQPVPSEHLARHPWGKIPVLEHDGFQVFETAAVLRYVDEAFPGPILQSPSARERARMAQAIGIIDSYGYGAIVTELFVQRFVRARFGEQPDEAKIAAALPQCGKALDALLAVKGNDEWLAGAFSLADIHLAPVYAYMAMTPEGLALANARPALLDWWTRMSQRPSIAATASPLED